MKKKYSCISVHTVTVISLEIKEGLNIRHSKKQFKNANVVFFLDCHFKVVVRHDEVKERYNVEVEASGAD